MRMVVLVNGVPGSGKSTLAAPLSKALDLPLLSKDAIKEALADVLGVDPSTDGSDQRAWRSKLGAAASEALWRLVATAPSGAVVDSTLPRHRRDLVEEGLRRAGVEQPLELWCDVPPVLARERCVQRALSRHPIHGAVASSGADSEPVWQPLGLGPLRTVDTRRQVDVGELVAWCLGTAAEDSHNYLC